MARYNPKEYGTGYTAAEDIGGVWGEHFARLGMPAWVAAASRNILRKMKGKAKRNYRSGFKAGVDAIKREMKR